MLINPVPEMGGSGENSRILLQTARNMTPWYYSMHCFVTRGTWTHEWSARISLKDRHKSCNILLIWNFRLNYFWFLRIQTQYLIERKLTLHGPLSSPPEQIFPSLIAPSQRSLHSDWARTGVTTTWSSSGLFTPLCAVFPHPEFSQSTPSNKIKILIIVNIISILFCLMRKT